MRILGINALYHDPSAALVVDGTTVAAAEEERFSRRKHGKRPVPFSAWEQPELAAAWCLDHAGVRPDELDAVTYSFDPALRLPPAELGLHDPWDDLRQTYAERAPDFLATALPGLDPIARPLRAAPCRARGIGRPGRTVRRRLRRPGAGRSRGAAQPSRRTVLRRRAGDPVQPAAAALAGTVVRGRHRTTSVSSAAPMSTRSWRWPPTGSLGTSTTCASSSTPPATAASAAPASTGTRWRPPRSADESWTAEHADLASSLQTVLEEVLLELTSWLPRRPRAKNLTLAGGVALNCVANTRIFTESGFEQVWVQPAAGDAGTALGGALYVAQRMGEDLPPFPGADLGRAWSDEDLEAALRTAKIPYDRPPDIADTVAEELAADGIVAWFQGRSEFGPRALGHRSLLAHPGRESNLRRLNDVKGREQFRPVAPMVLASRAAELFSRGPIPSPYMLFVHDVADGWRDRIPAAVHVDGTARIQSVDPATEPLVARMLQGFEQRTGLPVVINTSLNTAGRPMVDSPRDALECFGSTPVDLLAIGPFAVRRRSLAEHE